VPYHQGPLVLAVPDKMVNLELLEAQVQVVQAMLDIVMVVLEEMAVKAAQEDQVDVVKMVRTE
jgi:hypothetical protein